MKFVHGFAVMATLSVCGALNQKMAIASDITRQLQQQSFGITSPIQRTQTDALLEEGRAYLKQGNRRQAIQLWKAAAEQYRLLNDMEGQQRSFEYLSQAYRQQNSPTELEYALRQQLRFARARQDFPALVSYYNQVGEFLLSKSSAIESEKTFLEALRIAQNLQDEAGQGRSLTNLGLVALQRGNTAQAITYLSQAIVLQRRTPNLATEAIAHNALGVAYANLGDTQKSAAAHMNALLLARAGSDVAMQDRAMVGLATAYCDLGATSEAKYWLENRLASSRGTPSIAGVRALQAMAECYQRNGDLAQTDRYYRDAIAMATQGGYVQEAKDLNQKLENLRILYHRSPRHKG